MWVGGGYDEKERIQNLISLFRQQVKVNVKLKKVEIKYDKDTRKIENKFIFLFSWKLQSLLLG